MKTKLSLAILFVLILAVVALPASAHALLVRSNPEANAELAQSPQQIDLYFSEGLEPSFSSASVLNTDGQRVDNKDSAVDPSDPTHMTLTLKPLPDGVYTVSWKAISTSDGHLTNGTFPFAVGSGNEAALAATGSTQSGELSLADVILGWLTYLSAAVVTGGAFFRLVVWEPGWQAAGLEAGALPRTTWNAIERVAVTLLILVGLLALMEQGGKASGQLLAIPWGKTLNTLLFNSRFGGLWCLRWLLSLALAGFVWNPSGRRDSWLAIAAGLGILLSISFGSHAAADAHPVLPVMADWVHLMAGAAWVGGLSHFAPGMWAIRRLPASERTRLAAVVIPRFTRVALPSVGVIALTGLYSAFLRVGTLQALVSTLYGQFLLAKSAIALVMIALGGVNFLYITPRMRRGAGQPEGDAALVARFRRIVTAEIALGVVLMLVVGFLTAAPPAQLANAAPSFQQSAKADDLSIDMKIEPAKVGLNVFTVTLTSGGKPVDNAKGVQLKFTPRSNLAPSTLDLPGRGGGQYIAKAANLSQAADWQVQVAVRREGKFDSFANFDVNLGGGSASTFPWGRVAGGLLLLAGFGVVFATNRLGLSRSLRMAAGAVPALALAAVGAWTVYRPPEPPQASLVNPITPNEASVGSGKALYLTNCVPCHGTSGKGDGPVGLTLNPRPADLTYHATPGVHSDGQLWGWITNGYPGSAMPAFKNRLSDNDRWNLVNYIRTLAPVPQ